MRDLKVKYNIYFLCAICILISGVVLCSTHVCAADTTTVAVNVEYGQTKAREMLPYINSFRTGSDAWYWNEDNTSKTVCSGLGTLTYSYALEKIAMQRAAEIALKWAHERPNGTKPFSLYDISYYAAGENLALNFSSDPYEAFDQLAETSEDYDGQGHRRNMLSSNFNQIGIGHASVNGVHFWVQEFARTTDATPATTVVDAVKSVNVDVLSSSISYVEAMANITTCSMLVGEKTSVPGLKIYMKTTGTWSGVGKVLVDVPHTWNVGDVTVAKLNGGEIEGLKVGETMMTTKVLGKDVTVVIHVLAAPCTIHVYDDGVITKQPTCKEKGEKTFSCKNCGVSYTQEVGALGHSWASEVSVLTAATCTEDGEGAKRCMHEGCMWYIPVSIPAKGHTVIVDPAVEATVEAPGWTEGSHCKDCGLVFVKQNVVPKIQKTSGDDVKDKPSDTVVPEVVMPTDDRNNITVVDASGTQYAVTQKTDGDKTISYASSIKGKIVEVPSVIKVNGVNYSVTQISTNAFKNNKTTTKIVIPATVCNLGSNLFVGCKKLKTIVIKSDKLTSKNISKKAFKGVSSKVVIKVPKKKVKNYTKLFRKKGLSKKVKVKSI